MSIKSEKDKLRTEMLASRNNMSAFDLLRLNEKIFANLIDNTYFASDDIVALYASVKNEASTRKLYSFLQTMGTTILYPRISRNSPKKKLVFVEASIKNLKAGKFNIPEPNNIFVTHIKKIDTIIVPGLAFDTHGNRLGFGGGYYDNTLRKFTGEAIGICYDFQLLDEVPVRLDDVRINKIITDKRLIEILD